MGRRRHAEKSQDGGPDSGRSEAQGERADAPLGRAGGWGAVEQEGPAGVGQGNVPELGESLIGIVTVHVRCSFKYELGLTMRLTFNISYFCDQYVYVFISYWL